MRFTLAGLVSVLGIIALTAALCFLVMTVLISICHAGIIGMGIQDFRLPNR